MPQNRTEKVPNVPSEFLENMFFSQPFPLFQSPISSPAAAAAQKHLPAPKQPLLLLLLTEESQEHLPAPKQQGTEGRTCRFFNPISPPAAAVAAAANRRVARAPPGTKTARHGRTNMPQNRTEKVPNVPSEFLEKMFFSQPFPLFQSHQLTCCCCCPKAPPRTKTAVAAAAANRRVARAPPGTKTARHGRTNRP